MAISFISQGTTPTGTTGAVGTTSVTPALPGTIATGDIVVIYVVNKAETVTPSTPASWSLAGTVAGGQSGSSADASPVRATVFYRVKDAGWSTMPAITVTGGTGCYAQAFVYRNATGFWDVAAAGGSDSTSGTSAFSATTGSNPGLTANDWAVVGIAAEGDAPTWSAQSVTATGVSAWGTMNERSEPDTTNGNDMGGCWFDVPVNTGTSTAAPVILATGSVTTQAITGAGLLVRLREMPVQKAASDTASIIVTDKPAFDLRARHTGTWHCAHRGSPWMAPEETLEAYARSYADPDVDVLEIDARISADGTIWCSHDANSSRLFTTTATIATASDATLAALTFNNAGTDAPIGWTGTYRMAKLSDVLALYADKILISIEPKTLATGQALPALCNQYFTYKNNVVFPSFDDTYTEDLVAAGYKIAVRDESPTTAATMLAKGAVQTNIQLSGAPQSWVADVQSNGIEVWVWTINTQSSYATAVARGVKGVISDDPGYVQGVKRQTGDPYATQLAFHGYKTAGTAGPPPSTRGLFTSPDEWGIDNDDGVTSGVEGAVNQGWANPINGSASAPAYYTIDFEAKMITVRTGVSNVTIGIAANDTEDFAGGAGGNPAFQGYSVFARRNGNNHIRINNGDGTDPALTSVTAQTNLTLDTWYTYKLEVTPTSITFTNVTTGFSSTTTDTTYTHGNYIWFGAAGSDARYRNVVITDNTPAVTPKAGSDTGSVIVSDSASVVVTEQYKSATDTGSVISTETTATTAGVTPGASAGAVSINLLTDGIDGGTTTTYSTPSISPGANKRLLVFLASGVTGDHTLNSVTGLGLTWNHVVSRYGNNNKAHIYWADTGGSPGSGAVTFTFAANVSKVQYKVVELSGATASPIVQSGATDGTVTPISFSLTGVVGTNAVFAFAVGNSSSQIYTAGSGYTEIGTDQTQTGPSMQSSLAWDVSGTNTVSYDIDGAAFRRILLGVEIAAAPASSGDSGSVIVTDTSDVQQTTPTTPIAASDTGSLIVSDTSSIARSTATTDTGSVIVTESVATQASRTLTDTGSVIVTESIATQASVSASDTGSVIVTDVATVAVTTTASDTGAVAAADTALVQKNIPASDTGSVIVSDSASVAVTEQYKSATDTSSVIVSETITTTATAAATDTGAVVISDASVIHKTIDGTDTGSVIVSDVASVVITETYLSATDTSALVVTETLHLSRPQEAAETVSISIDDQGIKTVPGEGTQAIDTSSVILTDAAAIFVTLSANDTGAITLSESYQFGTLAVSASDSTSVIVTDTGSKDTEDNEIDKSGSDTSSVAVSGTGEVLAVGVIAVDTITTGVIEARAITSYLNRTDTGSVIATDTSHTNRPQVATENVTIFVDDDADVVPTGTFLKSASDSGSVAIADASSVTTHEDINKSASDSGSVSIAETSSIDIITSVAKSASDTGSIIITEAILDLKMRVPPKGRIAFDSRWSYAIMLNRSGGMGMMMGGFAASETSLNTTTEEDTQIE